MKKTSSFAAAALALTLLAPTATAQSSLSSLSSSSSLSSHKSAPTAQPASNPLNVRDVYSCPSPSDVNGQANWKVNNTTGLALTVYVADDEGYAYQVLERVGSPAVRDWAPKLKNGTYHLVCVFHNDSAVPSKNFTVADSPFTEARKMVPVTDREISAVSIAQAAEQRKRLPELSTRAQQIVDAIHSDDRATAQRAYLSYLEYYRSFDDSNDMWPGEELDGYADVEKLLWSDAPVTDAAGPAEDLAAAVKDKISLIDTSHFAIPAPDYGLRTHEVFEEFERFDLRGERDFGAHALPVALRADVTSTRTTLNPLRSLVEGRGLDTAPIYEQLDALEALANELDPKYDTAYSEWDQADRLRLQAAVARVNELLAPVATMTQIRRIN